MGTNVCMASTKMSQETLQSGLVIEDTYCIVRRIGVGGMGEVYEATHARLAGRHAIKLPLREIASAPVLIDAVKHVWLGN